MTYDEFRTHLQSPGITGSARMGLLQEALACDGMTAALVFVAACLNTPGESLAPSIGRHPDEIDGVVDHLATRLGWEGFNAAQC